MDDLMPGCSCFCWSGAGLTPLNLFDGQGGGAGVRATDAVAPCKSMWRPGATELWAVEDERTRDPCSSGCLDVWISGCSDAGQDLNVVGDCSCQSARSAPWERSADVHICFHVHIYTYIYIYMYIYMMYTHLYIDL